RLAAYLRKVTGQSFRPDRAAWTDWLTKTHPDVAAKLGGPDGVDVAGWQKRFAGIDWGEGHGERGQAVFTKASCATCHSGGQAHHPSQRWASPLRGSTHPTVRAATRRRSPRAALPAAAAARR